MKKKNKKGLLKKIQEFFTNVYNKFMELPKKNRIIIILWCVILLFLIIIIVVSNINNSYLSTYTKLEKDLKSAALKYSEDKDLYGINSQKVRLEMEILVESGYLELEDKQEDSCVGYALV